MKRLWQVIEVNRSSFYAWDVAAPTRTRRAEAGEELAMSIRVAASLARDCADRP